jgi:PLD-like domain
MEFLAPSPWNAITKALRGAKYRRIAVTAYLQAGALEMLPLRRGDTLVVNASDATLKSGATNPHEIEKFIKRRVRCYTVAGLHAKIFIAGNTVIVGSSNASANSRDHLIEAGISLTKGVLADQMEEWIQALPLIPIDADAIAKMKKIYRAPKWQPTTRSARPRSTSRIWITWLSREADEPESEGFARRLAKAEENLSRSDSESSWISQHSAKPSRFFERAEAGDQVICIDHREHPIVVNPPSRVLAPAWAERSAGKTTRYIAVEDDPERDSVSLARFLSAASRAGVDLAPTGKSNREISAEVAAALRTLWK